MMAFSNICIPRCAVLAAGVFSSRPMHGSVEDGFAEIIFGAIMGAFIGLLIGLIAIRIVRYCMFMMGRPQPGYSLTIASVLAGAILFAVLAAKEE